MKPRRIQRRVFRLPRAPAAALEPARTVPQSTVDFLSQQLVEPRAAVMSEALIAYERGARISVRRMPAGYRKTIVT